MEIIEKTSLVRLGLEAIIVAESAKWQLALPNLVGILEEIEFVYPGKMIQPPETLAN
jgi:hypothetical protein